MAAPRLNRRQMLKGVGLLGGLAALGTGSWYALSGDDDGGTLATPSAGGRQPELDRLADAAVSGGPGKDGIPSIDEPKFVPASEATFLSAEDRVFGLVRRGEVRAYPQLVLVWHEIVNDTVAGEKLAVTYCPLTGTVIAFTGLPGRQGMTFGTTGRLVNSNLLMYDRQTNSEWPQILGTAISGELKGQTLTTVPLAWSTWRAWRARHPGTRVLSTDTGALRDYGRDPYGSYPNQSGYYVEGEPIFPVEPSDDRFDPKDVVIGVRSRGEQLAIPKALIRDHETVDAEVGGTPIVARWDRRLDTARVMRRDNGHPADFLDAMWFAWYAFYPRTEVMT